MNTLVEKIKPLKPSLREKKRYLVFEVISKKKADFNAVQTAIQSAMLQLIGTLGTGKAGIIVLKERWDQNMQRGMVRVNNKYLDHLKASLSLIQKIGDEFVIVRSVGASGIIKKAAERYMRCL